MEKVLLADGQMQEAAGLQRSCNGVIGIIGALVLSLQALYYQSELNKIWAHLGNPEEGSPVTLSVPQATTQAAAEAPAAADPWVKKDQPADQ